MRLLPRAAGRSPRRRSRRAAAVHRPHWARRRGRHRPAGSRAGVRAAGCFGVHLFLLPPVTVVAGAAFLPAALPASLLSVGLASSGHCRLYLRRHAAPSLRARPVPGLRVGLLLLVPVRAAVPLSTRAVAESVSAGVQPHVLAHALRLLAAPTASLLVWTSAAVVARGLQSLPGPSRHAAPLQPQRDNLHELPHRVHLLLPTRLRSKPLLGMELHDLHHTLGQALRSPSEAIPALGILQLHARPAPGQTAAQSRKARRCAT